MLFPRQGARSGYRLLITWMLVVDAIIAMIMQQCLSMNGFDFAQKALFPAASILVSMSVAWTARAATVLNDKSFRESVVGESNPLEDYVYGYQLSILMIMSTVIYISIMAAGGFRFYIYSRKFSEGCSSFFLYFFLSISIRECWSVINFSNLLSLLHSKTTK